MSLHCDSASDSVPIVWEEKLSKQPLQSPLQSLPQRKPEPQQPVQSSQQFQSTRSASNAGTGTGTGSGAVIDLTLSDYDDDDDDNDDEEIVEAKLKEEEFEVKREEDESQLARVHGSAKTAAHLLSSDSDCDKSDDSDVQWVVTEKPRREMVTTATMISHVSVSPSPAVPVTVTKLIPVTTVSQTVAGTWLAPLSQQSREAERDQRKLQALKRSFKHYKNDDKDGE
jgi:hypothetical protein